MAPSLTFPEELLLFALHDSAGTLLAGTHCQFGIAAGVLAELLYQNRISLEVSRQIVNVEDRTPTGNAAIDECFIRIREARRRKRLQHWVTTLSNGSDLRHNLAGDLARKGVLRAEEDKTLLIFRRKLYPELDPQPELALIERMGRAIFEEGEVDARTAVTECLADATELLPHAFERKSRRGTKKRLKAIADGDAVADAAKDGIAAMQAGVP